jgi:hypothetical protein
VGARSLNIELQAVLNPAGDRKVERFGWTFAPGDSHTLRAKLRTSRLVAEYEKLVNDTKRLNVELDNYVKKFRVQ